MNRRDVTEPDETAALEAYRAAAHAEADALFDDRALEAQRHKILARLAHLGQSAKVIPFPHATAVDAPAPNVNRRWISVAAAAGLIIGLLGGQVVNLLPTPTRRLAPMASSMTPSANNGTGYLPARMTIPQDDGLLGEVDFAVQVRSASELQALDELTPFHEPQ
ncbi:MAG: hypothetical protein AB7P34_01160 [Vicinamibacterales bacterium]